MSTKKRSTSSAAKPARKAKSPSYTYIDHGGTRWRMVGSRPVSDVADSVMRNLGLPLR